MRYIRFFLLILQCCILYCGDYCCIKTIEEFNTLIHEQYDPLCVIVTAPWCHICTKVKSALENIMHDTDLNARMRFMLLDFDETPAIQSHFKITRVPTFCIFDAEGRLIAKQEGIKQLAAVEEEIRSLCASTIAAHPSMPPSFLSHCPSFNETKSWVVSHCKGCLIYIRNGIDTLIEKCFN